MNKLNILGLIIAFYILTLFQNSFLIHFRPINLVLLVFTAMLFNKKRSLFFPVLCGFFLDILSSYFFGIFTLFFIFLYFIVIQLKKRVSYTNFIGFSMILFFTLIIYYSLFFLTIRSFNFFDFFYNFLFGILIYFIFKFYYVCRQRFGR